MGRPKDAIWDHFYQMESGNKIAAMCKLCGRQQSARTKRMRIHYQQCVKQLQESQIKREQLEEQSDLSILESPLTNKRPSSDDIGEKPPSKRALVDIGEVVFKTNNSLKEELHDKIYRLFHGCKIPFEVVEHPLFLDVMQTLQPSYRPPTYLDLRNSKDFAEPVAPAKLVSDTSSTMPVRPPLTSHVLDTTLGKPAVNLPITVYKLCQAANHWNQVVTSSTDGDGRAGFMTQETFTEGEYKIKFDTKAYFVSVGREGFYPYVEVVFEVKDPSQHYHVPLLLSPYGYSTYRGT